MRKEHERPRAVPDDSLEHALSWRDIQLGGNRSSSEPTEHDDHRGTGGGQRVAKVKARTGRKGLLDPDLVAGLAAHRFSQRVIDSGSHLASGDELPSAGAHFDPEAG